MAKLPGNVGVSMLGDKSLEFYRDPVSFCGQRIDKHRGRVFQSRLLNRPTVVICSMPAMRELLCDKSGIFVKDPTDLMTNVYGDTIVTTNGEEASLLRLSLTSLFTGSCLESSRDFITRVCERCLKDLSSSGRPECVYSVFKQLGTEMVLGLFLNIRQEQQPELLQEIIQLCREHWHGLISAPVTVKVPMWSSGLSIALEARDKLMEIIKDKLENEAEGPNVLKRLCHLDTLLLAFPIGGCHGNSASSTSKHADNPLIFVGSLRTLPLPDSSSAAQHLLLFISALIPKALASLLTSFTLALSGKEQEETRQQALMNSDFLEDVLLEVERLWPPFIGGRRLADKDTTLAGFHVPKGYGALYISHAVHRDPDVFQLPDRFLPERWRGRNAEHKNHLCTFGSGPRNCIGTKLTHVFLKEVCVYLLKHYDWSLEPPSQNLDYKWLPVSRPVKPPMVAFTPLDSR